MKEKLRYTIPLKYKNQVKSLTWVDDYLVDFAGGYSIFHLSGQIIDSRFRYSYKFDNAVTTQNGLYSVIYEEFGTKGLILKEHKIIREINRSFYHADRYKYPIVIFERSGKTYIAHCPEHYNIIEIEEIETGERITQKDRPSRDFFQSRLQVSPNNRWLLSAGWIWHPMDSIEIYDITSDISEPQVLTPFWEGGLDNIGLWEVHNAAFTNDSMLLMSGTGDLEEEDANQESAIVLYSLDSKKIVSRNVLTEFTGRLLPINEVFAVGFYENPKLINIKTGEISYKWIDIKTDKQNSSITNVNSSERKSHVAIDILNKRFAVAMDESIEVIIFE